MAKLKVAFLHNVVSFYRLPVFEEVGRAVDLEVFFCKTKTNDRKWDASLDGYHFKRRVLPVFQVGPFFMNPTLIWELFKTKYDVYLVGDFPETMVTTFATILVAKLRRKPVVLWSETVDNDVNYFQNLAVSTKFTDRAMRSVLTTIITGYRRILLKLPNRYVALSQLAELFLEGEGVNSDRISSGIQIMPKQFLAAPTISKADGPYAETKLLLYLGYLNAGKGINLLIQSMRELTDPSLRLAIVGAGPEEAALRALAAGDDRIEFYGYTVGTDKANFMSWADVFVLPTLADCWALVVNEALFYGTPVVTTTVAGASELLVDGINGLSIPAGDQAALTAALTTLTTRNHLRIQMKQLLLTPNPQLTDSRVGARPIIEALQAAGVNQ